MDSDIHSPYSDKLRSGFVTILGRPNSGKSTLLNAVVGSKIAIVAAKPQTTRAALSGVLTLDARNPLASELLRARSSRGGSADEALAQIVFLDTPGIQEPETRLDQQMMEEVQSALAERDLLLFLTDASQPFGPRDEAALEWVRRAGAPCFLLLTKIDLVAKQALLPLIERCRGLYDFREIIPISALTGGQLPVLVERIVTYLPEGPLYFPSDQVTEQPMRFLAGEIVREKVIRETRHELPYACAVLVREYQESEDLVRITADLFVEREGQKGILIGAGGQRLKRIGTLARRELETNLGKKVFLELLVRVRHEWREDPRFLQELDWHKMAGGA